MLTFIEERRRRIRKAYEEGRKEGLEEGRKEGLEEGRKEGLEEVREENRKKARADAFRALSLDPRIAALFREDPKIRQTLREFGIKPPD